MPIDGRGNGSSCRRIEAEVGAHVRDAPHEHLAGDPEPLDRAEDGLVREIDDDVGPVLVERAFERVGEGHAVVRVVPQLLRAAEQMRRHEAVRQLLERRAHDRRVVLAVDQGQGTLGHERDVTSSSMRPVYFS